VPLSPVHGITLTSWVQQHLASPIERLRAFSFYERRAIVNHAARCFVCLNAEAVGDAGLKLKVPLTSTPPTAMLSTDGGRSGMASQSGWRRSCDAVVEGV
jgi:hypothetical protein